MSTPEQREQDLELCKKANLGPLKAYPNPQRPGQSFVAEDKPFKPYPNTMGMGGQELYPAVPFASWAIACGLESVHAECVARAVTALPEYIREVGRLRAALETIAAWSFDIMGDCVADARSLAQEALKTEDEDV